MTGSSRARRFAAVAAVIGWGAVVLQFYLSIRFGLARGRGVAGGLVAFFGYFTVLTNILVAVALTVGAFGHRAGAAARSKFATFFSSPGVNSAIAVYIAVVGLTYSLLLRHTWDPKGLQLLADRLLHDLMPVLFLVYWWLAVPTRGLRWSDVARWAIYPLGYLAYALALGALGWGYPYPFIDVTALGYPRVFLNAAAILAAFAVIALALIAVSRLKDRARLSPVRSEVRLDRPLVR